MSEPLSPAHIKAIDRDYWDPRERALGVHQIIQPAIDAYREANPDDSPTNWDVMMWALEYINQQAVGVGHEGLLAKARDLTRMIYSIHYSNAHLLYGKPDKRRELKRRQKEGGESAISQPVMYEGAVRALSSDDRHPPERAVPPVVEPDRPAGEDLEDSGTA